MMEYQKLKVRYSILIVLLGIIVLFHACTKDRFIYYNQPFNRLVSHVWQVNDAKIDGVNGFDICNIDNTVVFSADSTMIFDRGIIECEPGEQRTIRDYWNLGGSESDLKLTFMGLEYSVVMLTEKELLLRIDDYYLNGQNVSVEIQFVAIR